MKMDTEDENPLVKIINDYKENHDQLEKIFEEKSRDEQSLAPPKDSSVDSLDYSKTNEVGGDSIEESSNSKEESAANTQASQARNQKESNSEDKVQTEISSIAHFYHKPSLGFVRIVDGLFLGDIHASSDLNFLVLNKISHLINCAGREVQNEDFSEIFMRQK